MAYTPNSLENARAALGTLGYYLRTMIFPIRYDMFLPVSDMSRVVFLAFGLLAVALIVGLVLWARKDKEVVLPASIFGLFWLGHIPLIYANILPYQIFSRYMMVAGLGLAWLIALLLRRVKERPRFGIVFLILLFFIPSIVINAGAFKNSPTFWNRAKRSSPNDAYVLFQAAKTAIENMDYLSAEVDLNRSLGLTMKRETAILVSLLYADIEMMRADYPAVLRWMASLEEFDKSPEIKIAPFIRYQVNAKKARVFVSRGDVEGAEKLLLENIRGYSTVKEAYADLYNLYVSRGRWPEAAKLEATMKSIFPAYFASIDTAKMEEEFASLPFDKKMTFFIQNRNFPAAVDLLGTLPSLDLDHEFLLARLFFYEGRVDEGARAVQAIVDGQPEDCATLNKAGFFYLYNMVRVKEALVCLERSLALNPSQPEVVVLVGRLKRDYLEKLKDVWPDTPH
jgi:tetratricopeptide (TPR) repeat protein